MVKDMKEHKILKAIPLDGECFATYDGPSEGVGLHMYITEDDYVVGLCKTKKCHQGYEDVIHGGLISTYFDEVLWYATTVTDEELVSVTVELSVKYLKAVPVDENIRIIAKPMTRDGRHLYVDGYILLENDQVAAEATGHFLVVREDHNLSDVDVYGLLSTTEEDIPESVIF